MAPGCRVVRSATRATVTSCASGVSGQRSGWASAMSCRTERSSVARSADALPLRLGLHLGHLRRQHVDGLDDCRAEALDAGVMRFRKSTAGIGAAAGKERTGLAVLAQDEGGATVGAVGGQPISGLGLRGLRQINGEPRHGPDPPIGGSNTRHGNQCTTLPATGLRGAAAGVGRHCWRAISWPMGPPPRRRGRVQQLCG